MNQPPQETQTVLSETPDKDCRTLYKCVGNLYAEIHDQHWDDVEHCWWTDSVIFLNSTDLAKLTTLLTTEVQSDAT
jgi:hypothetical protein